MSVGSALERGKTLLRRHIGIWVLFEARNKVLLARGAWRWSRFENAEVARLRQAGTAPKPALVATIIATYRRPELLRSAIDSALNQTITDHTVIVVDDGGHQLPPLPDDPRLTVVSLPRNTHVPGVVRNIGIRLTESSYLAFLDDDNTWTDNHLETALSALTSGADIVYTAIERYRSDGSHYDTVSRPFSRKELSDDAFIDTSSIVLRRDDGVVFSRLPRIRTTLPGEDWEFVYRLSRKRRTQHVAVPTVRYLVNEDSHYTTWPEGDRA